MLTRLPFFVCIVIACQAGEKSDQDADASRKAIAQLLKDQVAAWNKGDLIGFMAGYQRSKDTTFFSGSVVLKGWDAVLERYQKKYQGEGNEMGKLTFTDLDTELLGPDGAVVRGRWELVRSNDKLGGLFTLVFRKTSDGWRITHDHTSN